MEGCFDFEEVTTGFYCVIRVFTIFVFLCVE